MEVVQTISHHLQESNESLSGVLAHAQNLASRGMRLLEATAALAKAQTEHEVADVVLGKGLAAVGATRGFLASVDADRVEIVRASGFAPEVEARLVGPATELPALVEAVRTGQPVWVRSAEEHLVRYGRLYARVGIRSVPHASVSIPLRCGAEVVGAIGLVFVEASTFDTDAEAFSLLLGQAAADALARARSCARPWRRCSPPRRRVDSSYTPSRRRRGRSCAPTRADCCRSSATSSATRSSSSRAEGES